MCMCGGMGSVRLIVMTPLSLQSSHPTPAIVSCWATAFKPKTLMGRDLGPTGCHGEKHLVDGTSEASQAPPELCVLFAFGIIAIQALEHPSTHCPDLV